MDEAWTNRVEEKLDKLSEAVINLARMEERVVGIIKDTNENREAIGKIIVRLGSIENSSLTNGQKLRFSERVFWIVVTATMGYFFSNYGMTK